MSNLFAFYLTLVFVIKIPIIQAQEIISLDKHWEYRSSDSANWRPCTIPNTIHNILIEEGQIPNPYFSDNEQKVQYVGEKDYQFRTKFIVSNELALKEKKELILRSIDTYASVYLNNILLGTCNNAFRIWNFDLGDLIHSGVNELIIELHSNQNKSMELYSKLPYALPGGERVVTRKPQCHYGWDFGPKLVSLGLLSSPQIISFDKLQLFNASLVTKEIYKSHALVELVLQIESIVPQEIQIQWSLNSNNYLNKLKLSKGINIYRLEAKLPNPRLWWPNGSGEAFLYDTRLQLRDSQFKILGMKQFHSGVRKIKLVSKKDKWGKSFYFNVNGKPIFAKGSNYVPPDLMLNSEKVKQELLSDAYSCGFNMLRIWGGGNYESDAFYEMCDKLGIMIWQDFMFACALYPGDEEFVQNVKQEADEQVQRLSRFACIALWCGNNEINEAWHRWGWQMGLSEPTKQRLWKDYQRLFNEILPVSVHAYSNENDYWESSPLYGRGDSRFQTEGDAHDWGVWHDELKFESFESRVPRFMSEAGFQSLPNYATVQSFCPEKELNLNTPSLLAHQKHNRGNLLIQEYLQRDLPEAKTFESLIYLNQLNQAEGMGLAINAHRRAKPFCMGTLYWQYNDCWPGISWSGRDYFGNWKALQHKTKELFQPVLLNVKRSGKILEIYAISDLMEPVQLDATIVLQKLSGALLKRDSLKVTLETNHSKRISLIDLNAFKFDEKDEVLSIFWTYQGMESYSTYYLSKLKDVNFLKPEFHLDAIRSVQGGFEFKLSSTQFAKAVYLKENKDLNFFPNFIDLVPDKTVSIYCRTNKTALALNELIVQSLYDFK